MFYSRVIVEVQARLFHLTTAFLLVPPTKPSIRTQRCGAVLRCFFFKKNPVAITGEV
ncbi:hypothetical protein K0F38_17070 [Bacteroides fragilis]|nr:hypothetical protein [Bacteroides fragilis]